MFVIVMNHAQNVMCLGEVITSYALLRISSKVCSCVDFEYKA